jgi:hypothetical protein
MPLKLRPAHEQFPKAGWRPSDEHLVVMHGEHVVGSLSRVRVARAMANGPGALRCSIRRPAICRCTDARRPRTRPRLRSRNASGAGSRISVLPSDGGDDRGASAWQRSQRATGAELMAPGLAPAILGDHLLRRGPALAPCRVMLRGRPRLPPYCDPVRRPHGYCADSIRGRLVGLRPGHLECATVRDGSVQAGSTENPPP